MSTLCDVYTYSVRISHPAHGGQYILYIQISCRQPARASYIHTYIYINYSTNTYVHSVIEAGQKGRLHNHAYGVGRTLAWLFWPVWAKQFLMSLAVAPHSVAVRRLPFKLQVRMAHNGLGVRNHGRECWLRSSASRLFPPLVFCLRLWQAH